MYTIKCTICQRRVTYSSEAEAIYRPFCGKRCQLIDLGRWLNEEYRVNEELPYTDDDEQDKAGYGDEKPDQPPS